MWQSSSQSLALGLQFLMCTLSPWVCAFNREELVFTWNLFTHTCAFCSKNKIGPWLPG